MSRVQRVGIALVFLGSAVMAAAPGARAQPVHGFRVRVVNTSPSVIAEVYFCPSGEASWGPNRLGSRSLKPGQRLTVRVDGECGRYDLRLVAADKKTEYLEEDLDFCEDDDVLTVGHHDLKRTKPTE